MLANKMFKNSPHVTFIYEGSSRLSALEQNPGADIGEMAETVVLISDMPGPRLVRKELSRSTGQRGLMRHSSHIYIPETE